jgi:thiol-disulfide isomerase/thioredoxin
MPTLRRPSLFTVAVLLLILGTRPVAADLREVLTVTGLVKTTEGKAVAGAEVFAIPHSSGEEVSKASTDENGAFRFTDIPVSDRVKVFAVKPGLALGFVHQVFANPVQDEPLEIKMAHPGRLVLAMSDPDGNPLPAAEMGEMNWNGPNGPAWIRIDIAKRIGLDWPRSDLSGRLEIPFLPDAVEVSGDVRHSRFARTKFSATVSGATSSQPPVRFNSGVELTLHLVGNGVEVPREGLELRMFSKDDGWVFVDERISVDAQGDFRAVIPAGQYSTVLLRQPLVQTIPGLIKNLHFPPGKPARLEITLTPRGKVVGRVDSSTTDKSRAGEMIEAFVHSPDSQEDHYGIGPGWYYSARAVTDEQGRYEISPGIGSVRIRHGARSWVCEEPFISIPDVRLGATTHAPDMKMGPGIELRGLVVDSQGNAVPRAVVQPVGDLMRLPPTIGDVQGEFSYLPRDVKQDPGQSTGSIELLVFDPFRPLSKKVKVPLDLKERTTKIRVELEHAPIEPLNSLPEAKRHSLIGKPAPDLVFKKSFNASDTSLKLADHRGKFVLLHFWATWCGPCKASMPSIEMAHNLYSDHGLVVLGIHHNSVPAADVESFIEKSGPHHVTLLDTDDGDMCKQYEIDAFPSYVLIDPEGNVILTSQEDMRMLRFELVATLRQYLKMASRF